MPQPPSPAGLVGSPYPDAEVMFDDRAATVLDHATAGAACSSTSGAITFAVELLLEQLDRRVEEPVHVPRADVARVVHDDVDVPPRIEDRHRGGAERRAVEEVAGTISASRPASRTSVGRRREAPGERRHVGRLERRRVLARLALVHGPGDDRDVEARLRERHCRGLADPAARPGDECDSFVHARTPGTVTVTVSRPGGRAVSRDRSNVPGRSPVSRPSATMSRPFTSTCATPCAST